MLIIRLKMPGLGSKVAAGPGQARAGARSAGGEARGGRTGTPGAQPENLYTPLGREEIFS